MCGIVVGRPAQLHYEQSGITDNAAWLDLHGHVRAFQVQTRLLFGF